MDILNGDYSPQALIYSTDPASHQVLFPNDTGMCSYIRFGTVVRVRSHAMPDTSGSHQQKGTFDKAPDNTIGPSRLRLFGGHFLPLATSSSLLLPTCYSSNSL